MERIVSFHKTAHGYRHIQNNQPCEDASTSCQDKAGRFFVAVVADGHGQDRSFRSGTGAACAAEIALNFLKETAPAAMETPEEEKAFYASLLESHARQQETIHCMTDSILARWHDEIRRDFL